MKCFRCKVTCMTSSLSISFLHDLQYTFHPLFNLHPMTLRHKDWKLLGLLFFNLWWHRGKWKALKGVRTHILSLKLLLIRDERGANSGLVRIFSLGSIFFRSRSQVTSRYKNDLCDNLLPLITNFLKKNPFSSKAWRNLRMTPYYLTWQL